MNMIPRIDLDAAIAASRAARITRMAMYARERGCHSRTVIPISAEGKRFVRDIVREVAERHGLSPKILKGRCRTDPVVEARHEVCYLAAVETGASTTEIGLRIDRDHSTVIHGIRRHAEKFQLPLPRGMAPDPLKPPHRRPRKVVAL